MMEKNDDGHDDDDDTGLAFSSRVYIVHPASFSFKDRGGEKKRQRGETPTCFFLFVRAQVVGIIQLASFHAALGFCLFVCLTT